jgi:hypothetical protein
LAQPIRPQDRDLFDEAGYLRRNPGLVEAIEARIVESGWDHYDKHGRREGRLPNDVEPDFYLAAYPVVAADLGRAPNRGDAAAHFIRHGRARGYLPNAEASRPDDPGAVPSPFGGGWTDRADAPDLIQNRFDLGRITDRQAERLRSWVRDGYVVFDLGTAGDRFGPALLALEQIFAGIVPGALFRCPALGPDPMEWVPELTPSPTAALDVHFLSKALRTLILSVPVARFLTELFDSPLSIVASEGVLRPILRLPRQDSASFGHTAQRQCATLWFGLDDPPNGDALHVYPGSHRLPEYLYGGRYKSAEEARRMGHPAVAGEEIRHAERLLTTIRRGGLERLPLSPPHGSIAILHPDLVYEMSAVTDLSVRRGIRAWIGPHYAVPLYAERMATRLHTHDRHSFTTAIYGDREPLDNPPD